MSAGLVLFDLGELRRAGARAVASYSESFTSAVLWAVVEPELSRYFPYPARQLG